MFLTRIDNIDYTGMSRGNYLNCKEMFVRFLGELIFLFGLIEGFENPGHIFFGNG
jgi:hypothetical protein